MELGKRLGPMTFNQVTRWAGGGIIGTAAWMGLAGGAWAQCAGSCSTTAPDFTRLSMVVELHVENPLMDKVTETAHVRAIAEAAYAHGVPLSIGLSTKFLDDYAADPSGLAELVSYLQDQCCDQVNLHAGVDESAAGTTIPGYLAGYLTPLAAAGGNTTVASAVCNEVGGPYGWVEAALDSGLTAVAGVVEYCQGSLRSSDPYYVDPATCSPGACHDASPVDKPEQRIATWRTRRTGHWVRPRRSHRHTLTIIGSFGDASLPCMDEVRTGHPCDPTHNLGYHGSAPAVLDADAFVQKILEAQNSYRSGGTGDVVHMTYSTNEAADAAWMDSVFENIQSELLITLDSSGTPLSDVTQWSTLPAVALAN